MSFASTCSALTRLPSRNLSAACAVGNFLLQSGSAVDHHPQYVVADSTNRAASAYSPRSSIPGRNGSRRSPCAATEVAARDRDRQRDHRHHAVHHVGIRLGPLPRIHAAHGHAENRVQMVDAQRFGHQLVLEIDDVAVIIVREFRLESIARLAGLSVADAVRKDQVVAVSRRADGPDRTAPSCRSDSVTRGCRPPSNAVPVRHCRCRPGHCDVVCRASRNES